MGRGPHGFPKHLAEPLSIQQPCHAIVHRIKCVVGVLKGSMQSSLKRIARSVSRGRWEGGNDDGIGLKIGLWSTDLVGVYLFPADGEIVAALYGPGNPGLGTMWLDKWLGLWVIKGNDGAPVASKVKPIKVKVPLPD